MSLYLLHMHTKSLPKKGDYCARYIMSLSDIGPAKFLTHCYETAKTMGLGALYDKSCKGLSLHEVTSKKEHFTENKIVCCFNFLASYGKPDDHFHVTHHVTQSKGMVGSYCLPEAGKIHLGETLSTWGSHHKGVQQAWATPETVESEGEVLIIH